MAPETNRGRRAMTHETILDWQKCSASLPGTPAHTPEYGGVGWGEGWGEVKSKSHGRRLNFIANQETI